MRQFISALFFIVAINNANSIAQETFLKDDQLNLINVDLNSKLILSDSSSYSLILHNNPIGASSNYWTLSQYNNNGVFLYRFNLNLFNHHYFYYNSYSSNSKYELVCASRVYDGWGWQIPTTTIINKFSTDTIELDTVGFTQLGFINDSICWGYITYFQDFNYFNKVGLLNVSNGIKTKIFNINDYNNYGSYATAITEMKSNSQHLFLVVGDNQSNVEILHFDTALSLLNKIPLNSKKLKYCSEEFLLYTDSFQNAANNKLFAMDMNFNIQWEYTETDNAQNRYFNINRVLQKANGNYLLFGYYYTQGIADVAFVELDQNGNLVKRTIIPEFRTNTATFQFSNYRFNYNR